MSRITSKIFSISLGNLEDLQDSCKCLLMTGFVEMKQIALVVFVVYLLSSALLFSCSSRLANLY